MTSPEHLTRRTFVIALSSSLAACIAAQTNPKPIDEPPMFQGIAYVYQSVPDVAKSCEFFEKKLGFKLHTNQPEVKGLAAGKAYLILHKDEPGFSAKERGAGANVCILVDDVDAYHAELAQRGVKVTELATRPWGQRDFYLTDPDGYSWCFAQAPR